VTECESGRDSLPVEYHLFATLAHLVRDTSKQTKGDQTNERGDAAGVGLD